MKSQNAILRLVIVTGLVLMVLSTALWIYPHGRRIVGQIDFVSIDIRVRSYLIGSLQKGDLVRVSYIGVFAAFLGLTTKDQFDWWGTEGWANIGFVAFGLGAESRLEARVQEAGTHILIVAKLKGYQETEYWIECWLYVRESRLEAPFGFSVGTAMCSLGLALYLKTRQSRSTRELAQPPTGSSSTTTTLSKQLVKRATTR